MNAAPIIPHAPPMRFLREATGDVAVGWTGTAEVDVGSPAAEGNRVRRGYLVELAAQLAAATAVPGAGGAARGGVLVGLRSWSWPGEAMAGRPIAIALRQVAALGPLRQFAAELRQDGALVAVGEIQVGERPDGGSP